MFSQVEGVVVAIRTGIHEAGGIQGSLSRPIGKAWRPNIEGHTSSAHDEVMGTCGEAEKPTPVGRKEAHGEKGIAYGVGRLDRQGVLGV
jgi:hypothetical protein